MIKARKMIDGIDITYYTDDSDSHLLAFPWEVLVLEHTGRKVNDLRQLDMRGLKLKLKPAKAGGYYFTINGSLHKYYNCGQHNYNQFTFHNLQETIHSVSVNLGIDPRKTTIHGLEFGVNIKLDFSPLRVLKNVVCYRSKPFTQINKKSISKGLQCTLSQYGIKIYDKAKQSGLTDENILRVEASISRMQAITKYGISTLADLQQIGKVKALINFLEETIKGIVWTDSSVNISQLTLREQKQWLYFSNPKNWQNQCPKKRYKNMQKWQKLIYKYGTVLDIMPMIKTTWENLFRGMSAAEKGRYSYLNFKESEAVQRAIFLPYKCTVKTSPFPLVISTYSNPTFLSTTSQNIFPKNSTKRINIFCYAFPYSGPLKFKKTYSQHPQSSSIKKCLSCGRDITNQRANSRFCSEAIFGKAGKACRNKQSNKIRTFKRSIDIAKAKDKFLIFTYQGTEAIYSDVLHPIEITPYKGFFDDIVKIKILN